MVFFLFSSYVLEMYMWSLPFCIYRNNDTKHCNRHVSTTEMTLCFDIGLTSVVNNPFLAFNLAVLKTD